MRAAIAAGAYEGFGNLQISGIDDNDRPWRESVTGRSRGAWLLKQLYVERKSGRRNKKYNLNMKRRKPVGRI